jgi:hypothetical protein
VARYEGDTASLNAGGKPGFGPGAPGKDDIA